MSARIERLAFDEVNDRTLFAAAAATIDDLPDAFVLGVRYFVAFTAWDSSDVAAASIASLARKLLDSGCVYFCCWGLGCERMHDIINEEYSINGISMNDGESTIMTTWHHRESLEEAIWFCLNAAFPDDRFFEECKAVLGISIGDPFLASQLIAGFKDLRGLSSRVVGKDNRKA